VEEARQHSALGAALFAALAVHQASAPAQGLRAPLMIAAAVPGRSFTVRYSGAMRFRETYARLGDSYRLATGRESRMPWC
jgi:hypothetical protein